MAYTELTCDEAALPLEELLRGAMKLHEDGTYSLQVVNITDGVTSFTLTSGSVTDTYTYDFDSEGRPAFVRQGFEDDADEGNPVWTVIWTDGGGFGFGWHISDEIAEVLYYSLDDVATPDLCTTWVAVAGSNPLPVFT
ncbi:MAG TPA: hypothetical protein PKJ19_15175 [Flavobacteriales bacterium]|nr:hypothetical protein [Flavobacteriales bacterium]